MDTEFKPFPCCGTKIGWFCSCCCCCSKKSDISGELGTGVSIYFKQMKNLIILLFICTLLSMPAYVLFYSGRTLNNPDTQVEGQGFEFDSFLGSLSLANIGEIST